MQQDIAVNKKDSKNVRTYELTYIFPPTLNEEEFSDAQNKLITQLSTRDAHITETRLPLRKRLAYAIARQTYGFMGTIEFWASPVLIPELIQSLRLHSTLLRFLVTQKEKRKPRASFFSYVQDTSTPRSVPLSAKASMHKIGAQDQPSLEKPVVKHEEKSVEKTIMEELDTQIPSPNPLSPWEQEREQTQQSLDKKPDSPSKKEKISLEEIDKKLDEIMKDIK